MLDRQRTFEQLSATLAGLRQEAFVVHDRPTAHRHVSGIGMVRALPERPARLGFNQLQVKSLRDLADDLVLNFEQVRTCRLEPAAPDASAGRRLTKLDVNADDLAGPTHAALDQVDGVIGRRLVDS